MPAARFEAKTRQTDLGCANLPEALKTSICEGTRGHPISSCGRHSLPNQLFTASDNQEIIPRLADCGALCDLVATNRHLLA